MRPEDVAEAVLTPVTELNLFEVVEVGAREVVRAGSGVALIGVGSDHVAVR
jgi:hypothetical protein